MNTEIATQQTQPSTRLWDALCKTDPSQAKKFLRSGGFSGTAVKPIYTVHKMTEVFGPCGIGWGMEKPEFITQPADTELLVFCTVGVWYVSEGQRGLVYGVGGDKYLVSQKSGLRASDEAFKMAYTDAVGNALKYLGVSADVHMGLFDDNKYVQSLQAEFADTKPKPAQSAADESQVATITRSQYELLIKTAKDTGFTSAQIAAEVKRRGFDSAGMVPVNDLPEMLLWAKGEA